MSRVPLTGGAYQARSVAAAAQRSVNLFSEPVPEAQGESMPAAHYPTPGTRLLGSVGPGPIRGIRQATTGGIYCVSGNGVYKVDPTTWAGTHLGDLTHGLIMPVSMVDNGLDMVFVDGSANGWYVTLVGDVFAQIDNSDGVFMGATRVDYLDTYFLFNKPNTPQFYSSDSLALTFDPLWFANKESYSDLLRTLVVVKRDIWLFGDKSTEIFNNVGKSDFPFESAPDIFIDHGIAAVYSVAEYDNGVFWLSADRQGHGIIIMGSGYQTKRISTYPIENEVAGYSKIDDAIGFCYQIGGHSFYVLTFPHVDKTWVYDITTGLWHEWVWIDTNGDEHRHRANCYWPINGVPVVGDWQSGNLYALDHRVFTDNGQPIKRTRSFPHLVADGKRVFYRQFLADFDTGNAPQLPVVVPAPPPYGVSQTQINTNSFGLSRANTSWGFPANTNFHTLLMSFWMCGPAAVPGSGGTGACGIWPAFNSAAFFLFEPGANGITLSNRALGSGAHFYAGSFALPPPPGLLAHCMMSVDTHAQVVQVWINDQPITVTGGTWTGSPPFDFNVSDTINIWQWVVSGVIASFRQPALADAWISNTPAFVDLSVEANRRKFINRDLTPVDLGDSGTNPFGYQPALYMSVRPGGVPADIMTNRGLGGGAFGFSGSTPPSFQATGSCTLPPPPPPLPVIPTLDSNLIWLSASDDRGHSYGNPVSQDIGAAGAYRTSLQWQRLGLARSRVFKIEWSAPMPAALLGCYVDATPAGS